jgi:hypothetical protein
VSSFIFAVYLSGKDKNKTQLSVLSVSAVHHSYSLNGYAGMIRLKFENDCREPLPPAQVLGESPA